MTMPVTQDTAHQRTTYATTRRNNTRHALSTVDASGGWNVSTVYAKERSTVNLNKQITITPLNLNLAAHLNHSLAGQSGDRES